jgi:peptide/nickel transport system permease protein
MALSTVVRKAWAVPNDESNRRRLEEKYATARAAAERDAEKRGKAFLAFDERESWVTAEREREAAEYAGRWARFWRDEQDRYLVYDGFGARLRTLTQTRFARWFGMLLRGDFGESYRTKRPVVLEVKDRLGVSLRLSLISVFIAYLIAIPLGIHSATRRGTRLDSILTFALFLLYSLPTFFVAEMLIIFTTGGDYPLLFPTRLLESESSADFPFGSAFLDQVWHLALPITVLTYGSFAYISRQMRSSMLETIRQDYVRTARAKGLSERKVIFKHALRNSLIPIVTLLGSVLPHMLSGSVIIEQIFTINGMGKLGFESVIFRDYPMILGISFFSALLTLVGIFISDLCYALVDPRISYE